VGFDLQRVAQHEFEFPLTEEKLDILDAAIELASNTPLVTTLTILCSPKFAIDHKQLLWEKGFKVSGSHTKDAKITLTFARIVKRAQGEGGASPLSVPKSAHEIEAVAQQVARADELLQRFSGAPAVGRE
jgi:hypothetical protein